MIKIKVFLTDGDYFITRINTTLEKAKEYYKPGTVLSIGTGPNDNLKTVEKIIELVD